MPRKVDPQVFTDAQIEVARDAGQPLWRFLANLGDVNPIEYGGVFVYYDMTGVYDPEVEILEAPEEDEDEDGDDDRKWTAYRVLLEPCTFQDGFLSDNSFHPELEAWFGGADDLVAMSDGNGIAGVALLVAMFTSDDPSTRACGYRVAWEHFGLHEFDQEPLTLNRAEVEERYPDFV